MTASTEQERVSLPLDLVNDLLALCTPEDHELRERVKQASRRAQGVQNGWKLVPVEPNKQMRYHAQKASMDHSPHGEWVKDEWPDVKRMWDAMLAAAPQPPEAAQLDDIGVADMAKRAALSAGPGIQKAVQALIDAAILEGGALPPSQEAAMQATDQRKADLLKLLEPFIETPLNE